MLTKTTIFCLVALSLAGSCARSESPCDSSRGRLANSDEVSCVASATAVTEATGDIKDVPATNPQRYPDSVGYLYQGSLATIFWLQNEPWVAGVDDLVRHMKHLAERGVAGEIVASTMQRVDSVPNAGPTLQDMATAAVQSVRAMAQYTFVTSDYAASLGGALNAYNADPARQQAVVDTAARLNSKLHAIAVANPIGMLPAPPPRASLQLLRSGKYLADAVKDHARERLFGSARNLQHAIETRDVAAYTVAFGEVFFRTGDIDLARTALDALAVHHLNGILRGEPLDRVIAGYVTSRDPDHPFGVDQLTLINQINLLANDPTKPRRALVAALLLIDEDHRQAEADPTLSSPVILGHVDDAPWLVSQLVRIRPNGTTTAQVDAVIDSIVANL